MKLFNNKIKEIILQLRHKNEEVNNEITKEIDELFEDIREDYDFSENIATDFSLFAEDLKSKLSVEDNKKLFEFSNKIYNLNRTAKKGFNAIREISRDQKKATRETLREYESLLYV